MKKYLEETEIIDFKNEEVVENVYRSMINSFIKLEMKEFEKLK